MAANRETIKAWLLRGRRDQNDFVVVVEDTFDHDDYPVYVNGGHAEVDTCIKEHSKNMQRVVEVYDLSRGIESQLDEPFAWHTGEDRPEATAAGLPDDGDFVGETIVEDMVSPADRGIGDTEVKT